MSRHWIGRLLAPLGFLGFLVVGCGEGPKIELRYDRPAQYEIPDHVKRLAIAQFGGTSPQDQRWGDVASDKLAAALDTYNRKFNRYELVDRKRLKALMDERDMQLAIADPETAGKAGKIAKVDAMIYGKVTVNTRDEQGVREIPNLNGGTTYKPYHKRYAMVTVNFTMDDISTSKTLATVTVSREYDSEHVKGATTSQKALKMMGIGGNDVAPVDQIVNGLVDECVTEILAKVSPHEEVVRETLGTGKTEAVDRGNKLAVAKDYAEALEFYRQAIQAKPDDCEAMFNAGLMLEALKKFKEASEMYDQAFRIKAKEQYILARKRVRMENGS